MAKGKDANPHIGIFGRRNNGKSSFINALAGQEVAIVSEIAGTTIDPVKKSIEIPMTSFSIMLARHKGDFEQYLGGTSKLSELKDGACLLILESSTHHVTCDDIGRIKIPNWVSKLSGKKLQFDIVAGLSEIKRDIHEYAIVIQYGGCMITRKQISGRLKPAIDAGIQVTNYGMAIALVHGIFDRAVQPFLVS